MIVFLVIHGLPLRQFYKNADALPYLDANAARHPLLRSVPPIRSEADGKTPNVSPVLDNRSGLATALLARPPLAAKAVLYGVEDGETVELFSGVVNAVSLTADSCTLELIA